jgi:hypothetical protein
VQQRSPLLFGVDSEASIAGRFVLSAQVHRVKQHLLELFVRKPNHLPLRMSHPMCSLP